jgi:hypothetical protein
MTLAAILSALVALALVTAIPPVLTFLPLGNNLKILGYVIPWPILIVLVSIGLAATYRYMPSRREAQWRWVSWGSVIATLIWVGRISRLLVLCRQVWELRQDLRLLGRGRDTTHVAASIFICGVAWCLL